MSDADVSTIFISGLPLDAQPRELENMMRFFVFGYEGVKMAGAKGGGKGTSAIFVKFDHSENALAAIKVLNGKPFDLQHPEQLMRTEMARSDMKKPSETVPRGGSVMQAYQPPPPSHAHPLYQPQAVYDHGPAVSSPGAAGPQKRQRTEEDPGAVDTVAIFGATDQGFTQYQLKEYFAQLPGFVCFKDNARLGGGFVKFTSAALAQEGIQTAMLSGLVARMARTSMSSPGGDQGADFGQAYQTPAYEPPLQGKSKDGGKGGKAGKGGKSSGGSDGPSVDTLILQGVTDKGWTPDSLTEVFQNVPGYLLFKANPRVGGGFVKFTDPQSAMDAIEVAKNAGIDAQMARSSMSSPAGDQGADFGQVYSAPAYEALLQGKSKDGGKGGKGGKRSGGSDGPSVDTLILQGVTDKGWSPDSLTEVFHNVPGYVLFKANPRVGGGFVKFTDPQSAMDAIIVAQNAGIDAQMARSSMLG